MIDESKEDDKEREQAIESMRMHCTSLCERIWKDKKIPNSLKECVATGVSTILFVKLLQDTTIDVNSKVRTVNKIIEVIDEFRESIEKIREVKPIEEIKDQE